MRDEKGFDFKVLCVAVADPHQAHVERLDQVRPHRLVEIEHFFDTYKLLEDKDSRGPRLARAEPGPRGPGRRPPDMRAGDCRVPEWARCDLPREARRRERPGRRLFVAVPHPGFRPRADRRRRRRLFARQATRRVRDVRWVRLDGLHLTLRFIGPTDEDRVAAVAAAVDRGGPRNRSVRRRDRGRRRVPVGRATAGPLARRHRRRRRARERLRHSWTTLCGRRLASRRPAVPGPSDPRPVRRRPGRADRGEAADRGRRRGPANAFRAESLVLFESISGGGPARYVPSHEASLGVTL